MGDLRNALKKFQIATRHIKLSPPLDVKEVSDGSVKEYLRVYHYLFLDWSTRVASDILYKHGIELAYANDKAFVDGVYRLCRDMLTYTPRLTKDQFFHVGYASAKAEMAADIIERVRGLVGVVRANTRADDSNEAAKPSSTVAEVTTTSTSPSPSNIAIVDALSSTSMTATSSTNRLTSLSSNASSLCRNLSTKGTPKKSNSFVHQTNVGFAGRYQSRASRAQTTVVSGVGVALKDNHNPNNAQSNGSITPSSMSTSTSTSTSTSSHEISSIGAAEDTNSAVMVLSGFVDKINEMIGKLGFVSQRVDLMDKRLANVERLVTETQSTKLMSDTANLGKAFEDITNKMTLMETELLVIKQSLSQQQHQQPRTSKIDRLSYDSNDVTTYETPHQSFMAISPNNEKRSGGIETETSPNDSVHDDTLNNDLTPTILEASSSRLPADSGSSDLSARAKELLQKASLLTSSLTTAPSSKS